MLRKTVFIIIIFRAAAEGRDLFFFFAAVALPSPEFSIRNFGSGASKPRLARAAELRAAARTGGGSRFSEP